MRTYEIRTKEGYFIGVDTMTPEQARKAEKDFIIKEAQPKRSSERTSKMATCQLMMASRNKRKGKGGYYDI